MRKLFILSVLLLLSPIIEAQTGTTEPPTVPSTASLQTLINSVDSTKASVSELKRDMAEFKIQIFSSLKAQQQNNLLFMVLFFLASLFAFKILDRFANWIIWRKRAKEIIDYQSLVLYNLDSLNSKILVLSDRMDGLDKLIKSGKYKKKDSLIPEQEPKSGKLRKIGKLLTFFLFLVLMIVLIQIYLTWPTR